MAEQTLIIVKPDAVKRNLAGEILSRFEKKGFTISKQKTLKFTTEMAKQFYSVHSSKPFFDELVSFITSGEVVIAIIERDNAVSLTREIIGNTNPKDASSGTMLAKNDGTVLWSCSSKCKKNLLVLKRDPRKLKWTKKYVKGGIKVKK